MRDTVGTALLFQAGKEAIAWAAPEIRISSAVSFAFALPSLLIPTHGRMCL
jgi:hypothetical protein